MFNFKKKKKFRKELLRKLFHLLELPVLIGYGYLQMKFGFKMANLALTALLLLMLEIEYIRLEYRLRLPEVIDILRRHEHDNVAGAIFFIAATIICFAAFDFSIAMVALLMTVFGDLVAALVGIRFGKIRIYKNKTLEGSLAGLIANLIVGIALLPNAPVLAVIMAITATITELWTGKLDDNLTVPIAAGFIGQMLVHFGQISLGSSFFFGIFQIVN